MAFLYVFSRVFSDVYLFHSSSIEKEDHLHRLNNDIKARIDETTGSILIQRMSLRLVCMRVRSSCSEALYSKRITNDSL